jgi:hypothetical protein
LIRVEIAALFKLIEGPGSAGVALARERGKIAVWRSPVVAIRAVAVAPAGEAVAP